MQENRHKPAPPTATGLSWMQGIAPTSNIPLTELVPLYEPDLAFPHNNQYTRLNCLNVCKPVPGHIPDKLLPLYVQEYAPALKLALTTAGMPEQLWPSGPLLDRWVRDIVAQGKVPRRLTFTVGDKWETISLTSSKKHHPRVINYFNSMAQGLSIQAYYFTSCEEWWNGEPHFLVENIDAAMEMCRHEMCLFPRYDDIRDELLNWGDRVKNNQSPTVNQDRLLAREQKLQARSKVLEAKQQSVQLYNEWLAACRDYREELVNQKQRIKELTANMHEELKRLRQMHMLVIEEAEYELGQLLKQGAPERNYDRT